MSWVSDVLRRFERVTPMSRPNTWRARCPAHDDRTPSLGIWLGRGGSMLLVRCWSRRAGCTVREIVSRVGLRMSDLFPPDEANNAYGRAARPRPPAPRLAEVYDYADEAGKLLYQVCRMDPKGFRQRRPDGKGGWDWSLGDVRRVLYRLPRIAAASPRVPVLVVEGERDVHTLEAWGFLATTNAMGAGKWLSEYSLSLRGRRVVVLPDADEAGQRHAYDVVGSLMMHGAASIRLCELPDLPAHGDVTDFANMGRTREELIELVRASPEWVHAGELHRGGGE